MNASRARPQPVDAAPPSVPQTTPPPVGYGHPEFHFVQSVMEMQKSLGEIKASIDSLSRTVDGTKAKVDDLTNWKHKIIGGAFVAGAILSAVIWAVVKISDHVTLKSSVVSTQPASNIQHQPATGSVPSSNPSSNTSAPN